MEKVTFIDNLFTTLNVFFSSSFFIYILVSIFAFFVLRKYIIDSRGEMTKKAYYLYILGVISLFIIIYSNSILKLWDKLMDNLFLNIYFPSLGIYFGIVIISIGLLITSIIKKKMPKITKKVNIFSSISVMFLFFLVMDTIVSNKIDVSADMFLYTNNKLLALIEVSTGIFALWMLGLGIIHVINKISKWFDSKESQKQVEEPIVIDINTQLPSNNEYSTLVNNLLEIKEPEQQPSKKNEEKEFLINEYKQMREYLMKVKQTNDDNYYMNNIMRDIFMR